VILKQAAQCFGGFPELLLEIVKACGIQVGYEFVKLFFLFAYLVVFHPHYSGWLGYSMLLHDWKQDVFLPEVMFLRVGEVFRYVFDLVDFFVTYRML
jgi:hypothetical protein